MGACASLCLTYLRFYLGPVRLEPTSRGSQIPRIERFIIRARVSVGVQVLQVAYGSMSLSNKDKDQCS